MLETLTRVSTKEIVDPQAQHVELRDMLCEALGIDPKKLEEDIPSLLPRESFGSAEDMLTASMTLSQQLTNRWDSVGYRPAPNVLLEGLIAFVVYAGGILKQALPDIPKEDIEERMKELGIRIRGVVIDSEGSRRNLRADRDNFTAYYIKALQQA